MKNHATMNFILHNKKFHVTLLLALLIGILLMDNAAVLHYQPTLSKLEWNSNIYDNNGTVSFSSLFRQETIMPHSLHEARGFYLPYQQQLIHQDQHMDTITTSEIDTTMNDKLPWNNNNNIIAITNDYNDNQKEQVNTITITHNNNNKPHPCDKILLYMPYFFSGHGQGFQINCYLMAALVSSFLDMALVVIEPGHDVNRFDGWSQ
eukprot:scaffold175353_cov27-Cyclotella_meneghiniana.AAC.1